MTTPSPRAAAQGAELSCPPSTACQMQKTTWKLALGHNGFGNQCCFWSIVQVIFLPLPIRYKTCELWPAFWMLQASNSIEMFWLRYGETWHRLHQLRPRPQSTLSRLGRWRLVGGNKKRQHLPNLSLYVLWDKCIAAEPTGGKEISGLIKWTDWATRCLNKE